MTMVYRQKGYIFVLDIHYFWVGATGRSNEGHMAVSATWSHRLRRFSKDSFANLRTRTSTKILAADADDSISHPVARLNPKNYRPWGLGRCSESKRNIGKNLFEENQDCYLCKIKGSHYENRLSHGKVSSIPSDCNKSLLMNNLKQKAHGDSARKCMTDLFLLSNRVPVCSTSEPGCRRW